MAETRPTAGATSVKATSVQPKKSSNAISWLAPIICVIAGYCIWRFLMGGDSGFATPDKNGGFWPSHKGSKGCLAPDL
jgi:biopolymer transport protein ExbB